MTDQVAVTIVRYAVDTASQQQAINSTKQVEGSLQQISLSAAQLGRASSPALNQVNARFADMQARIQAVKAEATALGDTTRKLNNVLAETTNAEGLTELGGSFGLIAREEGKAEEAAARLAARLHEIGASEAEIRLAASAFEDAANGGAGSGLFGSSGRLASIGREVKSLPAVPIPGTGVSSDAIAKITSLLGALGPAALTAGVGVVAVTGAIVLMGKQLEGVKKTLDAALEAQNKYYQDVANLTSQQVQEQIDGLKRRNDAIRTQVEGELRIVEIGKQGVIESFKGIFDAIGFLFGPAIQQSIQNIASGLINSNVQGNIDKLNAEYEENVTRIALDTQGLKDNAFARNDEIAATEAATEATRKLANQLLGFQQDNINSAADTQRQILQLLRDGSQEQLDALKASTQDEIAVTNSKILAEQKLQEQYKNDAERFDQIGDAIRGLENHKTDLINTMAALSDETVQEAVAENDLFRERQKIRQDEISAVEKYNTDIATLNQKEIADKLALYDKSIEKQQEIADKAAADAEKALSDLLDKQQSLRQSLDRSLESDERKEAFDALTRQIKFQRSEVDAEQKHQQDLERIRRQGRNREFELGLDRNFAGLTASRRQTAQELAESNEKANQEREDRLRKFAEANEDNSRQFIFERQQKLIKYAQDLQDAQAAEQKQLATIRANKAKQLQAAQDAYTQDLQALQNKYINERSLRQNAIQQELLTIQAGNTARLTLEQQFYEQAQQIIRNAITGISGGSTAGPNVGGGGGGGGRIGATPFALGGRLNPGQIARVNEPGSSGFEGFSTGRGSISFPGYGLFLPSTSGTVNSNNRSIQLSMPISITTSADPRSVQAIIPALQNMVDDRIAYAIEELHR